MSGFVRDDPMESKEKKAKRVSVSISLKDSERDELRGYAERYGLSLSAFLRLAAK